MLRWINRMLKFALYNTERCMDAVISLHNAVRPGICLERLSPRWSVLLEHWHYSLMLQRLVLLRHQMDASVTGLGSERAVWKICRIGRGGHRNARRVGREAVVKSGKRSVAGNATVNQSGFSVFLFQERL